MLSACYRHTLVYQQVLRLGMFEVHCDELIRSLAKRADQALQRLLNRMMKDHIEANNAYVLVETI